MVDMKDKKVKDWVKTATKGYQCRYCHCDKFEWGGYRSIDNGAGIKAQVKCSQCGKLADMPYIEL